jgi:GAF domain-containing protein
VAPRAAARVSLRRLTAELYIDAGALDRSLAALDGSLGDHAGGGLVEALHQVIGATQELFGATGAGIMMVDDGSALQAVAATDAGGRLLEERQQEAGEGPCVETLTFDRVMQTPDLPSDDRWPALGEEMRDSGVRAVLGVPLHIDSIPVGALNVYRDEPHDWNESEIRALQAYARLVENLLRNALRTREREQLAEQLQHALDHRIVIERAVGMIMQREQVSAVAAFNRLRHLARSSQTKAATVAERLIAEIAETR